MPVRQTRATARNPWQNFPMKLKIEIQLDSAAFDTYAGIEVARILRDFAFTVDGEKLKPPFNPMLLDVNGNVVGKAKVTK